MPPRKEPKEAVVYAASKRKPLPFKPQRPSKAPRTTSADTLSSNSTSQSARRPATTALPPATGRRRIAAVPSDDDDGGDDGAGAQQQSRQMSGDDDDEDMHSGSSSDLPIDPLQASRRPATGGTQRTVGRREPSPLPIHSDSNASSPPIRSENQHSAPILSQSDEIPTVPTPLLIRLLHEHFADKTTKIDKHAVQVMQKYVEIFVREAIARTALHKRERAEAQASGAGAVEDWDVSWLELEDLDRIAAGMVLDF